MEAIIVIVSFIGWKVNGYDFSTLFFYIEPCFDRKYRHYYQLSISIWFSKYIFCFCGIILYFLSITGITPASFSLS